MLVWPKLLTIAHAITHSILGFLPLYYVLMLGFDIQTVAVLGATCMLLKTIASVFWIHLVDRHQSLHGVFTGLLTVLGTAGILIVLSVPPSWTTLVFPAAVISSIMNGLLYQPIELMIDSAIIKILGDYRILYAEERKWGKYTSIVMCAIIGWSLDDDHEFDTLTVPLLVGSLLLLLLSISTSVQAADPGLLDPYCDDYTETIQFNKNVVHITDSLMTYESNIQYKPYSLFKEHLSHISEEDASMLHNLATMNSNSLRPFSRSISMDSSSPSFSQYQPGRMNVNSTTTTNEFQYSISQNNHGMVDMDYEYPYTYATGNEIPPSFELARLPFPSPETPVIVLISLLPESYPNKQYKDTGYTIPEEDSYYQHHRTTNDTGRTSKLFIGSFFFLGCVSGMSQSLNYIYFHTILGLPMHLIGIIGSVTIATHLIATHWIVRLLQHVPLYWITSIAHVTLIICTFVYSLVGSNFLYVPWVVIVIHYFQGLSFNLIWLLSTHQVDSVLLMDHKRLMLKGIMSAVYTGVGPALGIMIAGYIIDTSETILNGYCIVYQCAAVLTLISALLSWEWSIFD